MRIAVIQTAFPGDVIMSSAIFEALADTDKSAELSAVVRPESACLLQNNPNVKKIICYDKYGSDRGWNGVRKMAAQLKGYKRAFIVQRHFRSALVPYVARISERTGYDNSSGRILLTGKIKYRRDVHEVQRCLDLVGIDDRDKKYRPKIYLDDNTMSRADEMIKSLGITGEFAVVAPGSAWATKRYSHYSRLIDLLDVKLGLPVLLIGGPDDIALSKSIGENSFHRPHDLTGQTTLLESAAIISMATLVISNDSAPAHIAAAMGTPIVAIFGPTVKEFGFGPYSEKSDVVDIGALRCRPCSSHGSKHCPQKHFDCMMKLSPQKIIESARSLLG